MLISFCRFFIIFVICGQTVFASETFQDPTPKPLLEKAEAFFEAALYAEAIPVYQQALYALSPSHHVEELIQMDYIRLKIAQSFYFLGKDDEVLIILEKGLTASKELHQKALYLSSLAYRNKSQYRKAIEKLNDYLDTNDKESLFLHNEAQFEIALNYYLLHQLDEATRYFRLENKNPQLSLLSHLYLIRIDLIHGNHAEAEKKLNALSTQISKDNILQYELAYLHGEALFQAGEYERASEYFSQALPKNNQKKCPWYSETLYHLGWCFLKTASDPFKSSSTQISNFKKASDAFCHLLDHCPEEKAYLALGQCYLTQARCLKEKEAYLKAETLLSKPELFISREAQANALLLRAEASSTYELRDKFYRQLTQDALGDSSFYAKGWYLRGINDFEEGLVLLSTKQREEANRAFERAAIAFKKAFEKLSTTEKAMAGLSLKYQAQAYEQQNTYEGRFSALSTLRTLIEQNNDILKAMEHPDEIYYLYGYIASKIAYDDGKEEFIPIAEDILKKGTRLFSKGNFVDISLSLLAAIQYRKGDYLQAEETYLSLGHLHPNSSYAGEAWFWAANCSEKLGKNPNESKERRRQVFENYPKSSYAPEAYFSYYSYREYLQGDRSAVKHLQSLASLYPETPFLIPANYLLGLDYKRDRKTAEGKWIRKKNLTAAIDAFQDVESIFDNLHEKELIPKESLPYYLTIRYRAVLERALANLAIADESPGAKKQIYLEYAEEVFNQLVNDFENSEHSLTKLLIKKDPYSPIHEESSFWLAQTYIKGHNDDAAEKVFSNMLDHYRTTKTTKGYFLSRIWYEQGMIALRRKEYALALEYFKHAEDTAKGKILNTDQRLDLLIQESYCHRALNQPEQAILVLSKVVNDNAISGQRLKAMYLRAEMYELQKRPELARKQLQTTAKKGGEWALKAKEKLEKEYGY